MGRLRKKRKYDQEDAVAAVSEGKVKEEHVIYMGARTHLGK
jgi:hypothetical protein